MDMMGSHSLHWVTLSDKGGRIVTSIIVFPYVRMCYSRLERDSPADFEKIAVTQSHVTGF